jgi:hypothetical protein
MISAEITIAISKNMNGTKPAPGGDNSQNIELDLYN